jgi:hypothetical protein
MGLTQEVASFVAKTRYRDIPTDVVELARGFILDGLGVALAGSTDECSRIVQAQIRQMDGREESSIVGTGLLAPAAKAALANGVAGHAMDYDDTQLSTSKDAVYGLLTHPTTPVLAAIKCGRGYASSSRAAASSKDATTLRMATRKDR